MVGFYKQTPTPPNEWLHDSGEGYLRLFRKEVYLPLGQAWAECTNLEREEFERTHPAPEPPENE